MEREPRFLMKRGPLVLMEREPFRRVASLSF
jgi:hypothetical protein